MFVTSLKCYFIIIQTSYLSFLEQGSVGTGVQVLSVSHRGIKLLKMVRSSAVAPDYFRVLRPYRYHQTKTIHLNTSNECIMSRMCDRHWSSTATQISCSSPFPPRTCWSSTLPTRNWFYFPPKLLRSKPWSTTSSQSWKRWAFSPGDSWHRLLFVVIWSNCALSCCRTQTM